MRVLAVLAVLATTIGLVAAAPHAYIRAHARPHGHRTGQAAQWTVSDFTQSVVMDASFIDSKNGFIVGGDNGVGANILRTQDGGVTFTEVPKAFAAMVMAVATSTISTTSAIFAGLGMGAGSVQYSVDGKSFTNSSQPLVAMQTSQDAATIVGTNGYAVAGGYRIYGQNGTINGVAISNDGGASFEITTVDQSATMAPVRYAAFPSANVGFISAGHWPAYKHDAPLDGRRAITRNIHVHDGSATGDVKRQRMHINFNADEDDELAALNGAGWSGAIYRSTDGFQTWQKVYSGTEFYFNHISCANEKVCFAAGENDSFGFGYRTEDGGDSWTEVLKVPGVSLMSATALDAETAFFGGGLLAQTGFNGTIYSTTNGGDSFTLTTLNGLYLTSIDFVDAAHGWATAMNEQSSCNVLIYA